MQLPDMVVSDKGGVLALVMEIHAWFTLCLEELLSLLGKTQRFRVYTQALERSTLTVQFGITQVGISAAGGVLFHHQIRIRAQLGPRRLWRVQT